MAILTVAILTVAILNQVAPLGTNLRHQLETSAKRSNKFSSGFNPDHYL